MCFKYQNWGPLFGILFFLKEEKKKKKDGKKAQEKYKRGGHSRIACLWSRNQLDYNSLHKYTLEYI